MLQGLTYAEAPAAQPDAWACLCSEHDDVGIPGGGESVQQLAQRVKGVIDRLAVQHPGKGYAAEDTGDADGVHLT